VAESVEEVLLVAVQQLLVSTSLQHYNQGQYQSNTNQKQHCPKDHRDYQPSIAHHPAPRNIAVVTKIATGEA
jgi:hypothetical protein